MHKPEKFSRFILHEYHTNTMRTLAFLFIFVTTLSFSQNIKNISFCGVSCGDKYDKHYLTFLTDSTVRLNARYMGCIIHYDVELTYKKIDTLIYISPKRLSSSDRERLVTFKLSQFLTEVKLRVKEKNPIMIDDKNDFVYFDRRKEGIESAHWAINDTIYSHKKTSKILDTLKKEDILKTNVCRAMDAYRKYGEDYVTGVIEITTKK